MGGAGVLLSHTDLGSFPALPLLAVWPWGPTVPVHSFAQWMQHPSKSSFLVAPGTASEELRRSQPLRIPRDPGCRASGSAVDTVLQTHFLLMAHGKFGSLSSRPLPLGPEASLTLVLPWKGIQSRLPPAEPWSAPLQHVCLISCCLTSSPRTEQQPAPSGHMEASSRRPHPGSLFIWGKKVFSH